MARASFRLQLFVALMVVVCGVTAAALLATERSVDAAYAALFQERFASEVRLLAALREARLAAARERCLELAGLVRLLAAFEEGDATLLYKTAADDLRDTLEPPAPAARPATFFRLVSAAGPVIPPPDDRAGLGAGPSPWDAEIARVAAAAVRAGEQQVGYLAGEVAGRPQLEEVVVTPIVDRVRRQAVGALVIGFPLDDPGVGLETGPVESGLWLDGRLYSHSIPATARPAVARAAAAAREHPGRVADVVVDGFPQRLSIHALTAGEEVRPAYAVVLYSLAEALGRRRALRRQILALGGAALLLGLGLSVLLSRRLAIPIRELVAATSEIGRGNLAVSVPVRRRDELGQLGAAFNDMVAGLALKERYRHVLELVADRDVAAELLAGRIALGGELREASILFCDVSGFTALSETMPPGEMITLLNEHMTALTRVVHAHHGIVDKFVGDEIMAVFGAPRSAGDDVHNAARAACAIIAERARLNAATPRPLEVRIGLATGSVVAGCMGSEDRLEYTVVGARVNLAARLCAAAGRMEILIDETTRARLAARCRVDTLPPATLRGFRAPVPVYRLCAV